MPLVFPHVIRYTITTMKEERMERPGKTVVRSFSIPVGLSIKLDERAEKERRPRSWIVVAALGQYLGIRKRFGRKK